MKTTQQPTLLKNFTYYNKHSQITFSRTHRKNCTFTLKLFKIKKNIGYGTQNVIFTLFNEHFSTNILEKFITYNSWWLNVEAKSELSCVVGHRPIRDLLLRCSTSGTHSPLSQKHLYYCTYYLTKSSLINKKYIYKNVIYYIICFIIVNLSVENVVVILCNIISYV